MTIARMAHLSAAWVNCPAFLSGRSGANCFQPVRPNVKRQQKSVLDKPSCLNLPMAGIPQLHRFSILILGSCRPSSSWAMVQTGVWLEGSLDLGQYLSTPGGCGSTLGEKLDTNLQDFCQIPPCPSSQRSWMRTADSPLITDLSNVDSHHSRDSIRTSAEAPNQVEPRSQVGNRYAMSRTLNIVRGPWVWWMKSHRQGHPTCDPAWIRRPCSGLQFVFWTRY